MVVMEMIKYTYAQRFISICATLTGEEGKGPEAIFVGCRHGNDCIHMRTKFHLHVCYTEQFIGVSNSKLPEVIILLVVVMDRYILLVVVMETIKYTCAPSFSMCTILRSEEVISKKIACGYYLLEVVMETIEYTYVPSSTSMCASLSKL